MNTQTPDHTIRATELRQLAVKYGGQPLEQLECLAYDHAAGKVIGAYLRGTQSDQLRRVAFSALDLSHAAQGELRLEPPVVSDAPETGQRPVDTLTLSLPSGQTAYVRDSLIDPATGEIQLYEISLTPDGAGEPVRVRPDEITIQGDHWQVSPNVESRLRNAQL